MECSEGKMFLGGGWALYLTKAGFASHWRAPERVQALQALSDGTHRYTVTTHLAQPSDWTGQELKVTITCANVAS